MGQRAESCLGCGYSLEGTADGGVCPECGTPSGHAEETLTICGVAKVTETRAWRRWVWGFIFAIAFIYAQLVPFLVFQTPLYTGLIFAVLVVAVVGMVVTGSSRKRGTERFTFIPAGYARVGFDSDAQPEFCAWPGAVEVELKRVSSVWHRLRLVDRSEGKKRVILDAGVRCRVEDRDWIAESLSAMVGGEAAERGGRGVRGTVDG